MVVGLDLWLIDVFVAVVQSGGGGDGGLDDEEIGCDWEGKRR